MKVGINLNNPINIPDVIFEPDKFKNVDFEQNKKILLNWKNILK